MTLVYSPDDRGWYWKRRTPDLATSQIFRTQNDARKAKLFGKLRWRVDAT